MRISAVVDALTADLVALGALGSDATADAARRLGAAMAGPLAARLVEFLGQAAAELDSSLASGRVEVRLVGGDAELVYVPGPTAETDDRGPDPDASAAGDADARITLRLPTGLKARIEAAADTDGVSTNTYIVRRLAHSPRADTRISGRRLSGHGRS